MACRSLIQHLKYPQGSQHTQCQPSIKSFSIDLKSFDKPLISVKHQKAQMKRLQQEIAERKKKTFYALKPVLVQEYKRKLLFDTIQTYNFRRRCIKWSTLSYIYKTIKSMGSSVRVLQYRRQLFLERVFSAFIIKMTLKGKLRKMGNNFTLRMRNTVRNSFVAIT